MRAFLALTVLTLVPAMALAQDKAATKAFMNADHKMMAAMEAVKPTGEPDKDFVMMMIPHHQGAIDMAQVELKYGKDPQLLKMAHDIIDAQKAEIATMKKWLSKQGG
jgi:uncharacterized protein (DUF305 family)